MSEALDKARREIEELRRIINAQQSGLPSRLGVIVHSDDPTLIEEAIRARLAPYGLATPEQAEAAGCKFDVLCLPYCNGRSVDQTDPSSIEALRMAGKKTDSADTESAAAFPETLDLQGGERVSGTDSSEIPLEIPLDRQIGGAR